MFYSVLSNGFRLMWLPHLIAHQQAAARGVHLQTGDVAELDRLGAATVAAKLEHEGAG